MRLLTDKLEIPTDSPFENDALEREDNIKILTDVLNTSQTSFVLAINSAFGTGKTEFLRMWKAYLETQNVPCLMYNAWENDYSDSPLLTLMAAIEKQINQNGFQLSEESEEIFDRAKSLGGTLIKKSIPLALRLITGGILNIKDEDIEKTVSELIENTAEEGIDNYIQEQDEIEKFKNQLKNFVNSLTNDEHSKLVIFIDELDRCKPSFAVHVLEEIKHIFEIQNIYFILAVDSSQLNNSLRSIYGKDLDVRGYIKRFIDLEYELPKADIEKFIRLLVNKLEMDEILNKRSSSYKNDKKHFVNSAILLSRRFSISLRDFEHLFRKILIVLKSSDTGEDTYPHFLLFLIILKDKSPTHYNLFVNQEITVDEIFDFLTKGIDEDKLDHRPLDDLRIIQSYLIWYLNPEFLEQYYNEKGIKEELSQEKRREVARLADLQGFINRRIRTHGEKRRVIDKLNKKINMLKPLN